MEQSNVSYILSFFEGTVSNIPGMVIRKSERVVVKGNTAVLPMSLYMSNQLNDECPVVEPIACFFVINTAAEETTPTTRLKLQGLQEMGFDEVWIIRPFNTSISIMTSYGVTYTSCAGGVGKSEPLETALLKTPITAAKLFGTRLF